jgi:hypothetical protein
MPLYFLVHDADLFHGAMVPALAAAWRGRSFAACRDLCARLVPAAREYATRYHTGPEEPLLCRVAAAGGAVPFGREMWRFLTGEMLLYAAAEIPEFQTAPETLAWLLAPGASSPDDGPRERLPPIWQAHRGSRDLSFGGPYRPGQAGLNDRDDVTRLAGYLTALDPGGWTAAALAGLPGLDDEEERAEELAFARDCLASLRDLYERADRGGQVVVCEMH